MYIIVFYEWISKKNSFQLTKKNQLYLFILNYNLYDQFILHLPEITRPPTVQPQAKTIANGSETSRVSKNLALNTKLPMPVQLIGSDSKFSRIKQKALFACPKKIHLAYAIPSQQIYKYIHHSANKKM